MQQQLPRIELDILGNAVHDIANVLAKGPVSGYGYAKEKAAYDDAINGHVRCNAARWLGCDTSTSAMRMKISRAYASLERRGLIERIDESGFGRCTHLRPTDAGKSLAAELLAAEPTNG